MGKLSEFSKENLKSYLKQAIYNYESIKNPHPFFQHACQKPNRELLLSYAQEQPLVSYSFLLGLCDLSRAIISKAISDRIIDPFIAEVAFFVSSNLSEELNDPQARKSHIRLLGEYQNKVENRGNGAAISFTLSSASKKYAESMVSGMKNERTGLLYLAVMEMWMRPEYDFLEMASTLAGIPKESQVYFDANRDADTDHVDISIEGLLKLAKHSPDWDLSISEINKVIEVSLRDREAFWDQFLPLIPGNV